MLLKWSIGGTSTLKVTSRAFMQFRCTNSAFHLFKPLSNTSANVSFQYSFIYQVIYITILADSSTGQIMPRGSNCGAQGWQASSSRVIINLSRRPQHYRFKVFVSVSHCKPSALSKKSWFRFIIFTILSSGGMTDNTIFTFEKNIVRRKLPLCSSFISLSDISTAFSVVGTENQPSFTLNLLETTLHTSLPKSDSLSRAVFWSAEEAMQVEICISEKTHGYLVIVGRLLRATTPPKEP